jgi:hypothetical protein
LPAKMPRQTAPKPAKHRQIASQTPIEAIDGRFRADFQPFSPTGNRRNSAAADLPKIFRKCLGPIAAFPATPTTVWATMFPP